MSCETALGGMRECRPTALLRNAATIFVDAALASGKHDGRKSPAEKQPEVVALAKRLARLRQAQ